MDSHNFVIHCSMSGPIRSRLSDPHRPVKRILAIRLQASGDVMIAMPYLYDLRKKLPEGTRLDLLVREEAEMIPKSLTIFDNIYSLGGGRNTKLQLLSFLAQWPRLLLNRYDVLLDLQNHRLSSVMRSLLGIKAWTVFDRTSPKYAGTRYQETINALKLADVQFRKLDIFKTTDENALLQKFGLDKEKQHIVINPAGAFENRNWPLEYYASFCRLWLEKDPQTTFLVLGLGKISEKAAFLKDQLGDHLIDLSGRTTQVEGIHLLRYARLMVSDDSGLLHMAYCLGIPSVGILGSTRNDWTNPQLRHTYFFNSSDLPCGDCMLENCRFAEIKCLTRVSPEAVLEAAWRLTAG